MNTIANAFAAVATQPTRSRQHPLTEEQQMILDSSDASIIVIEAGAGCGKTHTLVELADHLGGRGQYTAFNSSLVADSKRKFSSHCAANTIHSLAFRQEGSKFAHRLNGSRVRANEVAAMLGMESVSVRGVDEKSKTLSGGTLASIVTRAVKLFCQSADSEINETWIKGMPGVHADDKAGLRTHLLPYAHKLWQDVTSKDGKLPYCHDYYVKSWQLNNPIISADYVLLDEAQDTSPVMLDVLAQQSRRGTKIIVVGDSAQQIYSWRGAVNALAAFPDAKRLYLSQSFRFGQVIAEVANAILANLDVPTPLKLRGFDKIPSRLASISSPDAVLCRTNAAAVQTLLTAISENKRPHLVGGGTDVLAFVRAAQDLQKGRRTEHPELACFESWNEVKIYSATDEGEDLKLMVKLIDTFGADKISDALKNMPNEKDADLVVCTAHKSKGREWHKVNLASDFMPLEKMGDEELRLLYVAATRAQHQLDINTCPPFCDGNDCDDDEDEATINLDEARRLSKLIADQPIEVVEQVASVPTKVETTQTNGVMFSWAKWNDKWIIRGPVGSVGTITVTRRNGKQSRETLGKVVWSDAKVALYEIAKR